MKIAVITLFPEYFTSPLGIGTVAKAVESGALSVELVSLRAFGVGNYRQVDDAPFGGGAGMVLRPGPLTRSIEGRESSHRVLFTPAGRRLDQSTLDGWAMRDSLTLVCGRYEGVDERFVEDSIDEEVSLGDFVLAGGEAAAAAVIEGVARLLPGVLGNPYSIQSESFRDGLLEEPQYTRPAVFNDRPVPPVLLSGDHARIDAWRAEQRLERTRARRPDLLQQEE